MSSLGLQTNDDIDLRNFAPLGRFRQARDAHGAGRNIVQLAAGRIEEMVMRRNVGIEINLVRVDQHFAHQSRPGEAVQRVIDGGQRHACLVPAHGGMDLLGGHMFGTSIEQHGRQRHALLRRAQARRLQKRGQMIRMRAMFHAEIMTD